MAKEMNKEKEKNFPIDESFEVKKKYESYIKKYGIPNFEEINNDFDIAKIDYDSLNLLRDVRKTMNLKFSSLMQFVELLLNPSNGSTFNMYLVRGINGSEKEILNELFNSLGRIEIDAFYLDIVYSEEKEADFIKANFEEWQKLKPKLSKVVDSLKVNWTKDSGRKTKSYFG